ncbi:MAG: hypothetical protein JNL50_13290 [Phycisphaerae bacterium]|nr:hypothetical protein [Phycisphaerae bacterium]
MMPLLVIAGCTRPSTPRFFSNWELADLRHRLCDMAAESRDQAEIQAIAIAADPNGGTYLVIRADASTESEAAALSKALLHASGQTVDHPRGYPDRWIAMSDEAGSAIKVWSPRIQTDCPGTRGFFIASPSFAPSAYAYPQTICATLNSDRRTIVQLIGMSTHPLPARVSARIDFDTLFQESEFAHRYGVRSYTFEVIDRAALLQRITSR